MTACLKQKTRCRIAWFDNDKQDWEFVEATNDCSVGDVTECPRVTLNCPTGEGYEHCSPQTHAEVATAALVPEELLDRPKIAYLYGHNWFCGPCQWRLQEVGVRTFIITGEAA